jgi:DNA polymerase III delta prime subunit
MQLLKIFWGINMLEEFLWVEKYRPKTVEETILPVELKAVFQQFVDQKNIPNLILSGSAGVGKTTIARAMLEQLECDYIVINGSMNGNIDTLRNEILNFASTISLSGGRKYVILDEADYLNANSTQPALRNFMEEFSRNCGFILTCNFKNRIIEPLHSRCSVIDFKISKKDMGKLAMQFMKRVVGILDTESVQYDKAVVAEVIQKHFPDWRRVLNELQRYSATGNIDSGILANMTQTSIKELISFMKDKNFSEVRKWIKNNIDSDVNVLYSTFYDTAVDHFQVEYIPSLVMLIGRYQYQNAFSANSEINFAAFCAEIMVELGGFK